MSEKHDSSGKKKEKSNFELLVLKKLIPVHARVKKAFAG